MLPSGIPGTTHRRTSSRNTSDTTSTAIEFVSYGSIPPSGISRSNNTKSNHLRSSHGGKRSRMSSSPNGDATPMVELNRPLEEEEDDDHHHHRRRSTITDIAALFCLGHRQPVESAPHSFVDERIEEEIVDEPTVVGIRSAGVVPGAVLNLCSATLGAGILALPYALLQSGLIVGGFLLVMAALATERSIHVLISVMHHHPNYRTYEDMTQHVLKSRAYRASMEISMLLFCGGCAVGYIIAIGDILEQSSLLFISNSRTFTLVFVWLVAMVPLSLLRNVQSLQYASAVGITAIVILVMAALVHYMQHHPDSPGATSQSFSILRLLYKMRRMGHQTNVSDDDVQLSDFLWPLHGFVSVFSSGPVFIFAFSCQANVCSIYDELVVSRSNSVGHSNDAVGGSTNVRQTQATDDTSKLELMHYVTCIAVCICAGLYCSISVIALADFGTLVQPNMLSCYSSDHGSFYIQMATAAMALAVVMAFPLNIFPARVTLMGLIAHTKPHVHANLRNNSTPHIAQNEGLTEALLADEGGRQLNDYAHDLHSSILPLEVQPDTTESNGTSDDLFDWTLHVVSTLFLTSLALCLALMLPNISVVFGLLGGTASSWLGFCVPGLLGIQWSKDHQCSTGENLHNLMITSWILYVGGIVIGLLTTGVTIYNTLISPSM